MSNDSQQPIKVGDELAFKVSSFGTGWRVCKVEKITKSGRIKAGQYEMNPDLTIRGRSLWSPHKAYRVTPELRKEIMNERKKNAIIDKVSGVRWREISLAKLQKIDAILKEIEPE